MTNIKTIEVTLTTSASSTSAIRFTVAINDTDMYMFRVPADYKDYDDLVNEIILSNSNTMKSLVECYQDGDVMDVSESSFMCLAYGYANAIASGVHHELESLNTRPIELARRVEMDIIGIRLVVAEEDQSRFALDAVIIEDDMPCDELTLYCDYDGSGEVRFSDTSKVKIKELENKYTKSNKYNDKSSVNENSMSGYKLETILNRKASIEITDFIFNF